MIIGSAKGGVTLPNENNSTVGLTTPASPVSFDICTGFESDYDNSTGDGNVRANKILATASGDVAYLKCNLEDVKGDVTLGLYSDDGGSGYSSAPDARLGYTASTTVIAGVNTLALLSTVPIISGTIYWISIESSILNGVMVSLGQTLGTSFYVTLAYGIPPDPFGGVAHTTGFQLCMAS